MAGRRWAAELLYFWFHRLRPDQRFARNEAVDAELRRRFSRDLASLARRGPREFLTDALTARAAILLFDQVPRNLFREDSRAFATDPLARAITHGAIRRGWLRGLSKPERQFLAMPLMHSENLADQRLSLRVYANLADAFVLSFARSHYRMIARFGRFPHRNPALGRTSTAAERRAVAAGNAW